MGKLGYLFFGVFAAASAFTAYLAGDHLYRSYKAHQWEPVSAFRVSVRAREKHKSGDEGVTHYVTGSFRYDYNGKTFKSRTIGIDDEGGFGFTYEAWEQQIREAVSAGDPIQAYVNPMDPEQAVLFREPVWDIVGFYLLFTITFGLVGFGGLSYLAWYEKRQQRVEQLKRLHPSQPWKWNPEWAEGRFPGDGKGAVIGVWAITIFWNALSAPALIAIPRELEKGNKLILIVLLFAAVGLYLLYAAIRTTIQWRKFGTAYVTLEEVPGVIGGDIRGKVQLQSPLQLNGAVAMYLENRKTIRSSGKNSSNRVRLLWQHERILKPEKLGGSYLSSIPFSFTVPYSAEPTDQDELVDWQLRVEAPTPGVDFESTFPLPVYRTESSSPDVGEEEVVSADHDSFLDEIFEAAGLKVRNLRGDQFEVFVPSKCSRNPGSFFSFAFFSLIWAGAVWLLIEVEAPLIFPIFFGIFLFFFAWALLEWLLLSCTVRVQNGELQVLYHRLGMTKEKVFPAGSVQRVAASLSGFSQSGRKHSAKYALKVYEKNSPRKFGYTVFSNLTRKSAAFGLAERITKALRLTSDSPL